MPPKVRYTKEQMIECAIELVRAQGANALTARGLATALGTSTAPLFTAFKNIEQIRDCVIRRAFELYSGYIAEGLRRELPFKGAGMSYIRFAKEEPELFKLLFMSPRSEEPSHHYPHGDTNAPLITETICKSYGIGESEAKKLHNHLSVYVHGIAVLYAQGRNVFSDEDIDIMLSEVFTALLKEIKNEKHY